MDRDFFLIVWSWFNVSDLYFGTDTRLFPIGSIKLISIKFDLIKYIVTLNKRFNQFLNRNFIFLDLYIPTNIKAFESQQTRILYSVNICILPKIKFITWQTKQEAPVNNIFMTYVNFYQGKRHRYHYPHRNIGDIKIKTFLTSDIWIQCSNPVSAYIPNPKNERIIPFSLHQTHIQEIPRCL